MYVSRFLKNDCFALNYDMLPFSNKKIHFHCFNAFLMKGNLREQMQQLMAHVSVASITGIL